MKLELTHRRDVSHSFYNLPEATQKVVTLNM